MYDIQSISPILGKCRYFEGIPEDTYENVLRCLQAHSRTFPKDGTILAIGEKSQLAGVVIRGTVELVFFDENGHQINVNHIAAGEAFGAELACSQQSASPMQLRALTQCQVLFLNFQSLLSPGDPPCPYRMQVAANLLRDFARQTLFLNFRLRIMGQKRLRDKVKIYLQSLPLGPDGTIALPFTRNEWADFLYVDRSALSRELSCMQREGVLTYSGRVIHMLDSNFLAD